MSLTGNRPQEAYRFELLDRAGAFLSALDGVSAGSLERSVFTELRHAGSMTLTPRQAIDWLDPRIRITYLDGADEYPLGVFIASTPKRATDGRRVSIAAELYSPLLVLAQDVLAVSLALPAGTVVTDALASVLSGAGLANSAITGSLATISVDRMWSAGTSKLKVVNDLLGGINYFSADVDGRGFVVASPWRSPATRATAWTFAAGEAALHRPGHSAEADYFAIPNRVVLVGNVAGAEMVATAEDYTSEVGYNVRGRWVTDFREGVEAADETTLQAIAARLLVGGRQVIETVELTHPYLPLSLNDVVAVEDPALGLDARYSLVSQRHALMGVGACVTSTLRRVVT